MGERLEGSVSVEIEADTGDLESNLVRDLERAATDAGTAMERTISESLMGVSEVATEAATDIGTSLATAAEESGSAFDAAGEQIATVFDTTGQEITDTFTTVAEQSSEALTGIGEGAADEITAEFAGAGDEIVNEMQAAADASSEALASIGEGAADSVSSSFSGIGDDIGGQFSSISDSASGAFTGVIGGATAARGSVQGLAAEFGLLAGGLGIAGAALSAQRFQDQLENTETLLRNQGKAAQFTTDQLLELARQRTIRLGIDTRDLLEAQNRVLRFGTTSKKQFDQTIEAAADMATIMGTDVTAAANILGRALQAPERGMTLLRRSIGQLSPAQEKLIKDLVAAGKTAEAQGVLLDIVSQKIGGAAERSADGTDKIAAAFANLTRTIGGPIIGLVDKFADKVVFGIDVVEQFIQKVIDLAGVDPDFGDWIAAFEKTVDQFEFGDIRGTIDKFGGKVSKAIDGYDPTQFNWEPYAVKFIEAIGAVLDDVPTEALTAGLVKLIVRSIAGLAEATPQIVTALLPIIGRVLVDVAIGLVEGFATALSEHPFSVGLLIVALGTLPAAVSGALAALLGAIPFAGIFLKPMILGLAAAGRALAAGVTSILFGGGGFAAGLSSATASAVAGAGAAFTAALPALIVTITVGLGIALGVILHNLIEKFLPDINRVFELLGASLVDFFAGIPGVVLPLLNTFTTGILRFFVELPGRIRSALSQLPALLLASAAESMASMGSGIGAGIAAIIRSFRAFPGSVRSAIGDLGGVLVSAGRSLVQGLINGVKSMGRTLINAILALIPGPVRRIVAQALQIDSPSKVFMGFGRNIVEGLIVGVEQEQSNMLKTLRGLAVDINQVAQDSFLITPQNISPITGATNTGVATAAAVVAASKATQTTSGDGNEELIALMREFLERKDPTVVNVNEANRPLSDIVREAEFILGRGARR